MKEKAIDLRAKQGGTLVLTHDLQRATALTAMLDGAMSRIISSHQDALIFGEARNTVILLDLEIPESLELIRKIRNINDVSQIIIFDTRYDADKCIQAKQYGASTFFEYPIQASELRLLVKAIYDADADIRNFAQLAYKNFLNYTDERSILVRELVSERLESGGYVSNEELSALCSETLVHTDTVSNPPLKNGGFDLKLHYAKTYIEDLTQKKLPIKSTSFRAFFPIHEQYSSVQRELIRETLGETYYSEFMKSYPTILIVEDEPSFRSWIKSVLRHITPNVIEAESASEALEKLKLVPELDIKILDIELPGGKSGVELHPEIDALFPNSQTIMLTAYDNLDYVESSFKNFAFDYLIKSKSNHKLLLEKISKALQKKAFQSVLPTVGKTIMDKSLSISSKYNILADISNRRLRNGASLKMQDVYLLFPELEASKIPGSRAIPRHILEDGIGLFIDMVLYSMKHKDDWREIFEQWDYYLKKK